jgi:hypothetical protein
MLIRHDLYVILNERDEFYIQWRDNRKAPDYTINPNRATWYSEHARVPGNPYDRVTKKCEELVAKGQTCRVVKMNFTEL